MNKRRAAAGMLDVESSFRRVRGHKDMAKVAALGRQAIPAVLDPKKTIRQPLNELWPPLNFKSERCDVTLS